MAVDVGSVRVGVALSDPGRVLASPLTTLTVPAGAESTDTVPAVAAQVAETSTTLVVVGLPLGLSGRDGAAALGARTFARALAARVAPVPVHLLDERFTTTTAHQRLAAAGRRSHDRREVVDQAAAVVLLQHALDMAANGAQPGELVDVESDATEGRVPI